MSRACLAVEPPIEPIKTDLCELAIKHGTDKCSTVIKDQLAGIGHNYTPYYHLLFKAQRESIKRVLEIGVATGASLRMWEEYFPNAEIIGVDNDERKLIDEGRISSYLCDQSSEYGLKCLRDSIGECELMIDDGSHRPLDQIRTCNILAEKLAVGGVYVIEDIQPPPVNYRLIFEKVMWPWKRRLFRIGSMADDVIMVMWRQR
jgi:hypothetical protein